jgi:hypothetical protein
MKTNREQERGNALIYVLIAIALFGALSMTLGRQGDTGESGELPDQKAELYATQLGSYAAQAKSAIDQMLFSNMPMDQIDFALPNSAAFNAGATADKIKRVYHPDGGGMSVGRLPDEIIAYTGSDPAPGWYMGRFNNIEWTKLGSGNTAGVGGAEAPFEDVVLVAYGINRRVCEKINEKITGSAAIPVLGSSIANVFVDDEYHTGTNTDLTTDPTGSPICAECHERASLCVEDQAGDIFAFYTILADR